MAAIMCNSLNNVGIVLNKESFIWTNFEIGALQGLEG